MRSRCHSAVNWHQFGRINSIRFFFHFLQSKGTKYDQRKWNKKCYATVDGAIPVVSFIRNTQLSHSITVGMLKLPTPKHSIHSHTQTRRRVAVVCVCDLTLQRSLMLFRFIGFI